MFVWVDCVGIGFIFVLFGNWMWMSFCDSGMVSSMCRNEMQFVFLRDFACETLGNWEFVTCDLSRLVDCGSCEFRFILLITEVIVDLGVVLLLPSFLIDVRVCVMECVELCLG